MTHRTLAELSAGLDEIRASPADHGRLELIVRRPLPGQREVLATAELSTAEGLVGDGWRSRGSRHTDDGQAETDRQVTVMNARAIDLIAVEPDRRPLAGDQLYVDLDLSADNIPAGTRLRIGHAVIEVTAAIHKGCAKFTQRFGRDATRLITSPGGRALRLRGLNARVVQGGAIGVDDEVRKLSP